MKLTNLEMVLRVFNENTKFLIQSNQQAINTNQQLESSIASLGKQTEEIKEKLK